MALSKAKALGVLGVEPPQIKGSTQIAVDEALATWKASILKAAFRKRAQEIHPDKNPNDPSAAEQFQLAQEAYAHIRDNLKVQLPPPPATHCPEKHPRIPPKAKFCHECGYHYGVGGLERQLRQAGLTAQTIQRLRADGTYDRLKQLDPCSPTLGVEITLLQHRQRLGLLGRYSGWP